MSLASLIDNSKTDKNTTHSYLNLYETLFTSKRETAQKVLEVGIGDFGSKNGGSIKLWRDFFTKATIYGLDILSMDRVMDELKNDERVVLYTKTNAYDQDFVSKTFSGMKFDLMLDDGPHTLTSMISFITLYSSLMQDDGILIIEDVQTIEWIQKLTNATPDNLKKHIKVYDLRSNKGRYDDIVFTIDKTC
jgi:hypothetical protein